MLNLGMMHHFGLGTEVDLDMAQIYYDKAMKEETGSSTYMTPVVYLICIANGRNLTS
jgi:TPR repeat protein